MDVLEICMKLQTMKKYSPSYVNSKISVTFNKHYNKTSQGGRKKTELDLEPLMDLCKWNPLYD